MSDVGVRYVDTWSQWTPRSCWLITFWDHRGGTQVFDRVMENQGLFDWVCVGRELCPQTGRAHSHLAIRVRVPTRGHDLVGLFVGMFGRRDAFAKLKPSNELDRAVKYCKKGEGDDHWVRGHEKSEGPGMWQYQEFRVRRRPGPRAGGVVPPVRVRMSREELAMPYIEMAERGATLTEIRRANRGWYFFNRTNMINYWKDCRYAERGYENGEVTLMEDLPGRIQPHPVAVFYQPSFTESDEEEAKAGVVLGHDSGNGLERGYSLDD